MYRYFLLFSLFLLLLITGFSFAQPDARPIPGGNSKVEKSKSERVSSPEKKERSEKDTYDEFKRNLLKAESKVIPAPVTINVSLRESDIYKSKVVAKHFPEEKLNKIKLNRPEKIDQIDFYFNKSFLFELLPGASDQEKVNDFIANFDSYVYETQRNPGVRTYIDNAVAGIRVVLLAETELPFKIPEKFKSGETSSECSGCEKGRRIPIEAGET